MKIKVCPGCGLENTDLAHVCADCRESLVQVHATRRGDPAPLHDDAPACETTPAAAAIYLEGPARSGFLARIDADSVVGRGAEIDVTELDPDELVSRRHLRLFREDGKWFAEHLGTTNPSFLDGAKLTPGRPVITEDGDRLTLAKVDLMVRFKS